MVQRTGVPADTVRAWERRYGVPKPSRSAGNQRLYSEQDLTTIEWLRDQTLAGLTISQAVKLFRLEPAAPLPLRADPDVFADEPSGDDSVLGPRLSGLCQETAEALVAFDAVRADRAIEEAMAVLPVEDVCLHVLQPVLYEIGHRWASGEIGIGAEHFASAFVLRKLGALFNLSQPEVGRGPLLAACLEGELHEVGLLLTCLFLSRRGYRIVYLGANLPLDDLMRAIERIQPPLVLLSASLPENAEHLAEATVELSERCRELERTKGISCPTIGFGGHVFLRRPDLRERIDGVFLGRNAEEATAAIESVLDRPAA